VCPKNPGQLKLTPLVTGRRGAAGNISNLISIAVLLLLLLSARPVHASNIVDIAVDEWGIPFVLDDRGHVWGFRKPLEFGEPVKLPNLEHIKKIAPYIAVDADGRVFTWSINDAEVEMIEDRIDKVGYTAPQRFGDLQGVTLVAYSIRHFVAVIDNRDIVGWVGIPPPMGVGFGIDGYGPIRKVISRKGVKAIAATTGGKMIPVAGGIPYLKEFFGLAALFDDGAVMGWGITPTGGVAEQADTQGVLLTKVSDATALAMSGKYTVILAANGTPHFWDECGEGFTKTPEGLLLPLSGVDGTKGYLTDVTGMALTLNGAGAAFIKRDGTVWFALYPLPPPFHDRLCPHNPAVYYHRPMQQLPAGKAAAVRAAAGNHFLYMLDADHRLWSAPQNFGPKEFHNIPINLK
jgi:hypothetical protein